MDNGSPTMFEEMKVGKFQFLLRGFCCDLPSLKKAAKYHAIEGIVLSILILVLGAGGSFLIAGLLSDPNYAIQGYSPEATAMYGVIFLAIGSLFLIYNLVLLSRVRDNRTVGVFKIIKVGCLVSLYIELIAEFAFLLLYSIIFSNLRMSGISTGVLIGGTLFKSLLFLLTALVIYGIHGAKPKLVSAFIYIKGILYAIAIILSLTWIVAYSQYSMIIPFILFVVYMDYYLKIFVLQVNMMTVDPVTHDHHQLINT